MSAPRQLPEDVGGVGLYIRRLSRSTHGTPEKAAARAKANGVRFVAILGPWQQPEKRKGIVTSNWNLSRYASYARAFKAAGIKVGIWFYPWAGEEGALLRALRALCDLERPDFLVNDAELGFKWKRSRGGLPNAKAPPPSIFRDGPVQGEAIAADAPKGSAEWIVERAVLLERIIEDLVDEYAMSWGHWFTSYGIAGYHSSFPWGVFVRSADVLSPQLYTATAGQVDRGIKQWRGYIPEGRYPVMLPSVGSFGKRSGAQMHDHLSAFVDGDEGVSGFIVWSWRQTSRFEWRILKRWASWVARGACVLPAEAA